MDWSLNKNEDFELIKQRLLWGTRGKNGNEPLKYLPLIELETSHLEALIEYNLEYPINPLHLSVIESILEDRQLLEKIEQK